MLRSLFVQNYALIDKLEIDFQSGLTVITGETGAGKSILLGALSLALGSRADLKIVKNKDLKCIIEVKFEINKYNLQCFFEENKLDFDEDCIIRREITPQGKSRAFINDTPVNLNQLKTLGESLIDIHSQHESLELNNQDFQISFVDTIANNTSILETYKNVYKTFRESTLKAEELKSKNKQQKERLDFIKFQYNELHEANLKPTEQEDLEKEQLMLANMEEIAEKLGSLINIFQRDELGVIEEIIHAKNELQKISEYFKNGKDLTQRINSTLIELEDISQDIETKAQNLNHNPERLNFVDKRLNKIYNLQQKHNCKNIEELLNKKNSLAQELEDVESFDIQLKTLEQDSLKYERETIKLASNLHEGRKKTAAILSENITKKLASLGMQQAVFQINTTKTDKVDKYGKSSVTFKFATDKTMSLRNVTNVASGGELSRIMLIIKSLIASKKALPTLIFDEIDTGVSGEIANKMGLIMKEMSSNMQIITITHLPQIAAKGKYHYTVYKTHEKEGATTRIKALPNSERINCIAQMLSSDTPTPAAIANAKELLSN